MNSDQQDEVAAKHLFVLRLLAGSQPQIPNNDAMSEGKSRELKFGYQSVERGIPVRFAEAG